MTHIISMQELTTAAKAHWKRHQGWLKPTLMVLAGLFTFLALAAALVYAHFARDLPDLSELGSYDPAETTRLYSSDGQLIATLFDENRTYVRIDEISPIMTTALVAVEDARFYSHSGVDLRGIARALVGNLRSGQVEQGASTLTMQLARRLFLNDDRTMERKIKEAILARRIERGFNKDQILEIYLNDVYFGGGAYGIDAAASLYFRKSPDALTVAESAMLAGLVQAPTALSPLVDPQAALQRQVEVLDRMLSTGAITEAQYHDALQQAKAMNFAHVQPVTSGMLKYPYFTTYAIQDLTRFIPERRLRGEGLKIYTTLDRKAQERAEATISQMIDAEGHHYGADTAAAVLIHNTSGEIRAMVGGTHWSQKDQFNRAWQAKRQPGSAFKPFVYAAALEAGFTPEHEFADTPTEFHPADGRTYKPANSDGQFLGAIPMRTGLQYSRNVVAAKVMAHVGPASVTRLARGLGIESELPQLLSLALGAAEVTPLEMAGAYSTLASGGVRHPAKAILFVQDQNGKVILDFRNTPGERVLFAQTTSTLVEMMERVVQNGTATSAYLTHVEAAGKTGTTDSYKDAWFVGFVPDFTLAVWMGRDDNRPMYAAFGGGLPARMWRNIMEKLPVENRSFPGLAGRGESVQLCRDTTYLATPGCSQTYTASFRTVQPTRDCPEHRHLQAGKKLIMAHQAGSYPTADYPKAGESNDDSTESMSLVRKDDPREDPEVVSAGSALIPYTEEAPKVEMPTLMLQDSEDEGEAESDETDLLVTEDLETPTEEVLPATPTDSPAAPAPVESESEPLPLPSEPVPLEQTTQEEVQNEAQYLQ